MTDFSEWARATDTRTRRCKVCLLPDALYGQVVAARAQGYGSIVISRFLAAQGTEVSVSSLENHFVKARGHER